MKKLLLSVAVFAAVATPAFASNLTDMICTIHDTAGHTNYYTFDGNTKNANGSLGGTMVETGYERDGVTVASEVGRRPIWIWNANKAGGVTLWSRNAPGWFIGTSDMRTTNGVWNGWAALYHNNRVVGTGNCGRVLNGATGGVTASNVGDQGL